MTDYYQKNTYSHNLLLHLHEILHRHTEIQYKCVLHMEVIQRFLKVFSDFGTFLKIFFENTLFYCRREINEE